MDPSVLMHSQLLHSRSDLVQAESLSREYPASPPGRTPRTAGPHSIVAKRSALEQVSDECQRTEIYHSTMCNESWRASVAGETGCSEIFPQTANALEPCSKLANLRVPFALRGIELNPA